MHAAAAGGVGGLLEAVGGGWDYMEGRHLRQLLRVFLNPFITRCLSPQPLNFKTLQP